MLRTIQCLGLVVMLGAAPPAEPTRVQASEEQKWATGPQFDGGLNSGLEGTIVVLNKAEASASLLDAGTGRERAKVQVGSGPHEVAISPDGATAVVANYGQHEPGHTLTVIDIPSMRAVRTIELAEYHRPHGIEYFPDGRRVAVTAEVEQAILVVDVEQALVESAVETGQDITHMLVLSPDASRIYATSIRSGTMTAIDVTAGAAIGTVATGAGAEGLDLSPDGTELWVGNRAGDTLSVIDTRTLTVAADIPCPGFPIRVKFTTDGRHVLVSNAQAGEVAVFDAAGRVEVKRIAMKAPDGGDTVPVGILVEPSGRYAFVANTRADIVTVLDLARWKIFGHVTAGEEPDGLGITPLALAPRE